MLLAGKQPLQFGRLTQATIEGQHFQGGQFSEHGAGLRQMPEFGTAKGMLSGQRLAQRAAALLWVS